MQPGASGYSLGGSSAPGTRMNETWLQHPVQTSHAIEWVLGGLQGATEIQRATNSWDPQTVAPDDTLTLLLGPGFVPEPQGTRANPHPGRVSASSWSCQGQVGH